MHLNEILTCRLYKGTIRFNVLMGAVDEVTQDALDEACKKANVKALVS